MTRPRKRIFTLREAQALLGEVRDLTAEAVRAVEHLQEEIEASPPGDRKSRLELRSQEVVQSWAHTVAGLGCEAKGLWLVDFDSGDGIYYCWRHPEEKLEFFHDYDAGFAGRKPLGPMLVN
jgi:hypothetical protein